MGLDLGENRLPAGDEPGDALRDSVESAIASALRLRTNCITFNTVSLKGRETELAEVCADLQKKFPALREIVPTVVDGAATAYLNQKPGAVKKFLNRFASADI